MLYAVSSEWLYDFYYNSLTEYICSQVNDISSKFSEAGAQVGNMMVKIILYHMFFLSNDVVIPLNKLLEDLAKNGLATGQGENVDFSINQILTFWKSIRGATNNNRYTHPHFIWVENLLSC